MKSKAAFTIVGCLVGLALIVGQAPAPQGQAAAPQGPVVCQAGGAPPPAQGRGQGQPQGQGQAQAQGQGRGGGQQPQGARDVTVTAIPGVVAAGVTWTQVWQGTGNNADGIVAAPDGGLLLAQEDNSAVVKLDANDRASVFLSNTNRGGSLSIDRQGRIFAVQRMAQAGAPNAATGPTTASIGMLAPERKVVANTFSDGTPWTGRPNDLAADSKGGAYFTQGCVYYASPAGTIMLVGENVRGNGIVLSPDDKTLYVTNQGTIVAFDVRADGTLANRRDFGMLQGGGGDGMAVDAAGLVYVTSGPTVQVLSPQGNHLGVIPTPRGVISVALAGADKKTLYIVGNGATGPDGQPMTGAARTIYKLPILAEGYKGRAK